jgi:hypothetical protein
MTTMRIGALTMMSCVRFGACARVPAGPNVGLGSPALASRLTSFQGEDLVCRQWAAQQAGNDTGARVGSEDRARRGHRHAPQELVRRPLWARPGGAVDNSEVPGHGVGQGVSDQLQTGPVTASSRRLRRRHRLALHGERDRCRVGAGAKKLRCAFIR